MALSLSYNLTILSAMVQAVRRFGQNSFVKNEYETILRYFCSDLSPAYNFAFVMFYYLVYQSSNLI